MLQLPGNTVKDQALAKLIHGESEAFEWMFRRYFQKVLHFVHAFTITKEDAEEVVHDVFLKVWETRSGIDPTQNFDALLFVIARNMVIDRIRKYARQKKHMGVLLKTAAASTTNNTEEQIHLHEIEAILDILIKDLPPKRRMILKLSREKGMKYHEIAELLQISAGTVEKQMSHALRSLRENLKSNYNIQIELMIAIMVTFVL